MKTTLPKTIACSAALFTATLSAPAQIITIFFTGEVTEVSAPLLQGVTVGSTINIRVTVDLDHIPVDSEPEADRAFFNYSGFGLPGYIFEIDTGFETITLDSVNAATGVGIAPGISLAQIQEGDIFDIAARDEGNPYGALLTFRDFVEPFDLLMGDYFPEDVNLAGGVDSGVFTYSDFINTNAIVATMTAAAMILDSGTPAGFLRYRVRVSDLPTRVKRALTSPLDLADRAYASDRCPAALKHLRQFQDKVRALVADPILLRHLLDASQELIAFGCP